MALTRSESTGQGGAGRGFTLIETLIVLIIVGMVVALVLPALKGVRETARSAGTRQLITDVLTASTQFQQDKRRAPGYFSPKDMGQGRNFTRGMSAMENAILDLAGEGAIFQPGSTRGVEVGPFQAGDPRNIKVDPVLIGTSKGSYFAPPTRSFVAQVAGTGQIGEVGHTAAEGQPQLPDLVDAWGSPLLMWVQDETAIQPIVAEADFVKQASDSPTPAAARFYMNANACFLNSTALGRKGADQTTESLIGMGGSFPPGNVTSLMGVLGNPGNPQTVDFSATPANQILPAAARGRIVVHSAGSNGVYVGKNEQGGKPYLDGAGALSYGQGVKAGSADVVLGFDDVVIAGGN